ncbi:MAG TPA: rhodanese-like domain-containing protein [Desulfobacterales bacterium]|nr:rhodanese-like domain-containing protein [Desulfobacterales bacterium]
MIDQQQVQFYEKKLRYEIDSWDLNIVLKEGGKVIVIDTRNAEAYEDEHIPGAQHLPHGAMSSETTSHFDKSFTYVTYCDGIGCNASTKGALNMTRLGFIVKELLGGIEWWRRDGYATEGKKAATGIGTSCGCS